MEDAAGQQNQQQQQQQPQQQQRPATEQQQPQVQAQLMTKLPGLTPSSGTTLIHRSGHCYQLHRPHLGLPADQTLADHQQQQHQHNSHLPPSKRFKVDPDSFGPAAVDSGKQFHNISEHDKQKQQQQHLASLQWLFEQNPPRHQHLTGHSVSHILDSSQLHHQHSRSAASRSAPQVQPASPSSTHVSSLYPEILALIFSKLDVADRGRAAQVCSSWREAAYHRSVWRGVEAKLHLRKHASTIFHCLEKRGIKRVQVLSLTMRRNIGEVLRGVSKLQSLNLSGCYNMSDAGLTNALSLAYPSLTELNLSLCKNITDASLGKIANALPNLEILELGGCSNITNMGLHVISWGLKKLRRLDLRSCWHVSDQGIGFLAGTGPDDDLGCPQLEHLGLQDCQRLSDEGLRHLADGLADSLRSINLSFCVLITDSGMKHVAKIQSMRELDLRSCDNISEIGMAYLAEGGSRISSLDVSFCDKIGDPALIHISQGLVNLKSLGLSSCPITDEGITKIACNQKSLESLRIGQCSKLTDRSIYAIIENMHELRRMDLYGCTRISKIVLNKLDSHRIHLNLHLWQGCR